jgi:hypothetical protein
MKMLDSAAVRNPDVVEACIAADAENSVVVRGISDASEESFNLG